MNVVCCTGRDLCESLAQRCLTESVRVTECTQAENSPLTPVMSRQKGSDKENYFNVAELLTSNPAAPKTWSTQNLEHFGTFPLEKIISLTQADYSQILHFLPLDLSVCDLLEPLKSAESSLSGRSSLGSGTVQCRTCTIWFLRISS